MAKVLSKRLREVLQEPIYEAQIAFIKGKQNLDAVLVANEVVEECRKQKREGFFFLR